MSAEEKSPDSFSKSSPKVMAYLKNPKKITIDQFEKIPKKLIANKKLEKGKIYYIEDNRRKKNYREVYQGMYNPSSNKDDEQILTFKHVSILVAPFGENVARSGYTKKSNKFYEATSIPGTADHSRFKDNIKDMDDFINNQRAAPVEEGETLISFIGKDYRKSKKNFETMANNASGKRKRKSRRNGKGKKKSRPQKSKRKPMRRKKSRKRS